MPGVSAKGFPDPNHYFSKFPWFEGWGQVAMDGNITAYGALLVLQYSVGKITLTDEQLRRADVDSDGKITAMDALVILQISAGGI